MHILLIKGFPDVPQTGINSRFVWTVYNLRFDPVINSSRATENKLVHVHASERTCEPMEKHEEWPESDTGSVRPGSFQ